MKKIMPIIFLGVALLGVAISVVLIFDGSSDSHASTPKTIEAQKDENSAEIINEVSSSIESYRYVLKEYEGKLAVFEYGSETPYEITEIFIHNLPDYDIILLSEGINVTDNKQLESLLEDYTS